MSKNKRKEEGVKKYLEIHKEFLNPQKVIAEIPLKPNFIVADFGCGSGFFAIPLAEKLEKGLLVGIDIRLSVLEVLSLKIREKGLKNIKLILGNLEEEGGSGLKDESCDMVLISNLLFQAENREKILKEAKRVLKQKGILVIIDWKITATIGPDKKERISKNNLLKTTQNLGFKLRKEFNAGDFHFGLILEK